MFIKRMRDDMSLRDLFNEAKGAGLARYQNYQGMVRRLQGAGGPGRKAYLRILSEFEPGGGNRVTLSFGRPRKESWEAHSVAFVIDAPLGCWVVTAAGITPVKLK